MVSENKLDNTNKPASDGDRRTERELLGTPVSRGLAFGIAVRLHGNKRQFFRIEISSENIAAEIERFDRAVNACKQQLTQLADNIGDLSSAARGIFEFHLLLLEQPDYVEDIRSLIRESSTNAEWAVKRVTEAIVDKLRPTSQSGINEKQFDVLDVGERILGALGTTSDIHSVIGPDSIVVASSIRPSTLVEISAFKPKGLLTEHGGWTSHAFIMAREMGIPAVTGLKGIRRKIHGGEELIVDGFSGKVVIDPSSETVAIFRDRSVTPPFTAIPMGATDQELATVDGRKVYIWANAESFESADELRRRGAVGVGLLRSEYMFGQRIGTLPSEEEQFHAYRKAAERAGQDRIRMRTFDLNADQLSFNVIERESNPSLGLRAIRLSLEHEPEFRSQIRAMLRANVADNVDILLPMVSGLNDIVRGRSVIEEERVKLISDGTDPGTPNIGVMVEVPSAVVLIDEIFEMVDFVCIGTNDLVQYLLAVDRDNESVADWYQTLHPAVIRSIKAILRSAESADKPAITCGEMAGSAFYAPLLIGLGAKEFSMNVNAISAVRSVISGISFEESVELARMIERSSDPSTSEMMIKQFHSEKWPHLFPARQSLGDNTENSISVAKK